MTPDRKEFSLSLQQGAKLLFTSRGRGLRPLLECAALWSVPGGQRVLIDRVTGMAAARVIAASRLASRVEAGVISEEAIVLLESQAIKTAWGRTTRVILRPDGSGACRLEMLSRRYRSDREFIVALYRKFSLPLPKFVNRIPDSESA